jgi:hypothetical protein
MQRTVNGAGSLLLRGLGPSGLLVSRGLGGGFELVIVVPSGPNRVVRSGGSGRRDEREAEEIKCLFVGVKLVRVNDEELLEPIGGGAKVCYGIDDFRITSVLRGASRRCVSAAVAARLLRKR